MKYDSTVKNNFKIPQKIFLLISDPFSNKFTGILIFLAGYKASK